jgi:predicted transposase/invertase (TIGR01784 family)
MNKDKPLVSFDYAIKYLLKDKGDYGIIEGFISALLRTQGYKDVQIIALLDSESNKEDPAHKRSLADLIVEDRDHNKYIVEIERNFKASFIHKACFNTSRLIVDNLSQGADYMKILKIFHISLLYFPVGDSPIYHGKTTIDAVNYNKESSIQIKTKKNIFDVTDIFPEYFFISIPLFNDLLKSEIDEWLYVLKHDHVPENFSSPYLAQVLEKLNVLKMTKSEKDEYFHYMKQVYDARDTSDAAEAKGEARGEEKKAIAMAKKMLRDNEPIEKIIRYTELTEEKIIKIQSSSSN